MLQLHRLEWKKYLTVQQQIIGIFDISKRKLTACKAESEVIANASLKLDLTFSALFQQVPCQRIMPLKLRIVVKRLAPEITKLL